jgi:MFS family permease
MRIFQKRTNDDDFRNERLTLAREIIMLFTVCSAQGIVQAALAQSLLPNLLIGESFHAQSNDTAWYPAAYALTCGAFMLPCGRVGDLIGHKRLFVGAWFWFSLWSLIAGVSSYSGSEVFFVVCRALQGVAAAALVPSALAILGTIYKPGPRKNLAFSLYASGAPIGFTLGAFFSALLAQLAAWPWAFFITCIVCFIYGFLALLSVPDLGTPSRLEKESFDYKGTFTIIAGMEHIGRK